MFWLWSPNHLRLRGTKKSIGREVLSVRTKVIRWTMSANLYTHTRFVKVEEEKGNKVGLGSLKTEKRQ